MWYKILIIVLASLLIILLAFSIGLVFVFLGRPKEKIDLKSDINGENNKKGFFKNIEEVNAIEEVKNRFLALSPKELTLDCSDGKKRVGYFYRSKTSNVLVVFSHGWKSNGLVNFGITGEYALKNDYNILVVDHLGHGKSDGNLMGFGIKDYSALTDSSCTLNLPPSLGRACAATEEAVLCFLNVRKQLGDDFPPNVISLLSQARTPSK